MNQLTESGLRPATTADESPFRARVTNPRNQVTKEWFQAFDAPGVDAPVRIDLPEGVSTTIARDAFGKPLELSRGGPGG